MSQLYQRVLATMLLCGISACANPERCDPSQAGLFTGAACALGGGYAERIALKEEEARSAEQRAADLAAMNRRLEAEIASLRGEERELAMRLEGLNGELAQNLRRLRDARATSEPEQIRLDALRREEARLTERLLELERTQGDAATEAEIRALETDNQALGEAIDALLEE